MCRPSSWKGPKGGGGKIRFYENKGRRWCKDRAGRSNLRVVQPNFGMPASMEGYCSKSLQ